MSATRVARWCRHGRWSDQGDELRDSRHGTLLYTDPPTLPLNFKADLLPAEARTSSSVVPLWRRNPFLP